MAPIRKGDGTGLAGEGYSQVRKGDGTVLWNAIPDSEGTNQWNWSEGSGTTVADNIGSLPIALNGVSWDTGVGAGDTIGVFDGVDNHGDLGSDSQTAFKHFTEPLRGTWAAWVRISDGGPAAPFGSTIDSNEVGALLGLIDGNSRFQLCDGSGTRPASMTGINVSVPDDWVFVAGTADESTARFHYATPPEYDVSVEASESLSGGTSSDWTNTVRIGDNAEDPEGTWLLDGFMDLQFVDDVGRSNEELQQWVDDTKGYYE